MASREKRPLAPSKPKLKANNDSGLQSPQSNRKRSLPTLRQQQLSQDFVEVAATDSQLSPKLEGALPRKTVIRSLRRKQKLRNSNNESVKIKFQVTKKVPIKRLQRLAVDVKKGGKIKKVKRVIEQSETAVTQVAANEAEIEGKSSKSNLRTKKTKLLVRRGTEDTESVPTVELTDPTNLKGSPKTTRKLKIAESAKSPRISVTKRNASKERDANLKGPTLKANSVPPETKVLKKNCLINTSTIDLTIEEVVSSMVSDAEHEDCQVLGGKVTRSRKMLIDEKIVTDIEIKKEILESEEYRTPSDDDSAEISQEIPIQLRNRTSNSFTQRSLRNGKLRQLSDVGIPVDIETRKRRWTLNMDGTNAAEMNIDNASDAEYSFSESSGIDNHTKDEIPPEKSETFMTSDVEETNDTVELENNNNSERGTGEAGPMLRSKRKAKSTEVEIKNEEVESEEPLPLGRGKSGSMEQLRKDHLTKVAEKSPRTRRSSLNAENKKSIVTYQSPFQGINNQKSPAEVAALWADVKFGIVEEVAIKTRFIAESNPALTSIYEAPIIDQTVVAPLTAESQQVVINEMTEADESKLSTNDGASNSSEKSVKVPKLADTAKEIEKLVMGEKVVVDTQKSELPAVDLLSDEQQVVEKESSPDNEEELKASQTSEKSSDEAEAVPDEKTEKSIATRKSLRNKSNESDDNEKLKSDVSGETSNESSTTAIDTTEHAIKINEIAIKTLASVEQAVVVTKTQEDIETLESIAKEVEKLVSEPSEVIANKEDTSIIESLELVKALESTSSETATDSSEENNDVQEKSMGTEAKETAVSVTTEKTNSTADDQQSIVETTEKPTKENSERKQEKIVEEQKSVAEENRRVLRARDKLKKPEIKPISRGPEPSDTTIKVEVEVHNEMNDTPDMLVVEQATTERKVIETENSDSPAPIIVKVDETPGRTRRSREVKRRKDETPQVQSTIKSNKRSRKDTKKSEQQNKEETLLDDEVATINENTQSLVDKYAKDIDGTESLRGFSEGGRGPIGKLQNSENIRSKSENDIENAKSKSECSERLSRQGADSEILKVHENVDGRSENECKSVKTPEILQKDSDEASTSGESSSSSTMNALMNETPEDKERKERILRLLGLESLEKAAERLNNQKAKKEQYTGTLKTVIRVQKSKDKKRSRSPLKMVLKQGRGDGEGDAPEFYTIQKEFGTSGVGDSSSDENNVDEAAPKDRQSLVIPEKSSSFSIHPGRCCADVCCHCFGKFGSLDTPMHLAQMKSDERRQKILTVEKHLNEDSCMCDACYRRVDRQANTSPTNMHTKPHRQLMVSKCSARDCREPGRHCVKRRWLLKVKARIHSQVDINWESSQHTSMSFCVHHYSKIEPLLTCALCTRRLAKNHTHRLAATETEELNERLGRQGIPVKLVGGTFVCKLCRYFTQLQLKYKLIQDMNQNSRSFFKDYRLRMLRRYDIEVFDYEEEDAMPSTSRDDSLPGTSKDKNKSIKKVKGNQTKVSVTTKSPEATTNSTCEKSIPEPIVKTSGINNSEPTKTKLNPTENGPVRENQLMDLESTVEKLKKRKALEQKIFTPETSITTDARSNEVLEILAMDKEVTLTRLPKRPRLSNDITPAVQRLGANPSISVRTLFPGEEEMNLHANVEFTNVREVTPQGWEKCATMIQYDRDTKLLWQELQRPYGNQSSFLRHLILLEKYYRSGDLVLAPNASRNAINYSTSVQNRLISYEGPEKMDEPIMEPISAEYNSPRRLSGGYVLERDRLSLPGTSAPQNPVATKTSNANATQRLTQASPQRVLKLNSGVSIIKKPPPSLQRINLPSGSSTNGNIPKRKDTGYPNKIPVTSGGKVFQLSEPEFKRLQNLKRQKQLMSEAKQPPSTTTSNATATTTSLASQCQKAAQEQFQKHLRIQQEMLNRQSRGDFEPLICDVRTMTNENAPTQNLLNNLNLPKSIQVTTKPSNPIPILPKIPKSLTVIPQTVQRTLDK